MNREKSKKTEFGRCSFHLFLRFFSFLFFYYESCVTKKERGSGDDFQFLLWVHRLFFCVLMHEINHKERRGYYIDIRAVEARVLLWYDRSRGGERRLGRQ
ncbi:hypothetical protein V6Z11_D09G207000 [Gossypium hirsutum]